MLTCPVQSWYSQWSSSSSKAKAKAKGEKQRQTSALVGRSVASGSQRPDETSLVKRGVLVDGSTKVRHDRRPCFNSTHARVNRKQMDRSAASCRPPQVYPCGEVAHITRDKQSQTEDSKERWVSTQFQVVSAFKRSEQSRRWTALFHCRGTKQTLN